MHRPIVVLAMFACSSICHHLQSLHKPQSDSVIVVGLQRVQNSPNAPSWSETANCNQQARLPCADLAAGLSQPPLPAACTQAVQATA